MENLSKVPSQVNFWEIIKKGLQSDLASVFGNVVMPWCCCFDLRWGRYKFPGASWSLCKAGKESSGNLRAVFQKNLHRLSFGSKNTKCDYFLTPIYTSMHQHLPKHQLRWVRTVMSLPFITVSCGHTETLRRVSFAPLSWSLWELECTASMIKNTKEKAEHSSEESFSNLRKGCL